MTREQNNVAYPADYRYLINFANRDVADQFWRAIQKAVAEKVPQWDSIGRITPQLYTHNPALKNIIQSVLDPKVAPHLFDKIFFQLLASRDGVSSVGTIPSQAITDHITGRTYVNFFSLASSHNPSHARYINVYNLLNPPPKKM